MSDSSTTTTTTTHPIFEVFNVGNRSREELSTLEGSVLRQTYSVISPLTSVNELTPGTALATIPKDGHMIVDKTQFQELIKKKVNEAVSRFEMERKAKNDERIFQVVEKLDSDKLAIVHFLKFLIDSESEKMSQAISKAFEDEEKDEGNTEEEKKERRRQRRTELEEALKAQKASFERSLNGPVFQPPSS